MRGPRYNRPMVRTLTIVYTSPSGHTEFVVDTLVAAMAKEVPDLRIIKQRAESTEPKDLAGADVLLLACGTWNTLSIEGQLSPHMHDLLVVRAPSVNLSMVPAAAIGLGDKRYHFTAKAAERLTKYLTDNNATLLLPTLKVINEPYDQTAKVEVWAKELARTIDRLPPPPLTS